MPCLQLMVLTTKNETLCLPERISKF